MPEFLATNMYIKFFLSIFLLHLHFSSASIASEEICHVVITKLTPHLSDVAPKIGDHVQIEIDQHLEKIFLQKYIKAVYLGSSFENNAHYFLDFESKKIISFDENVSMSYQGHHFFLSEENQLDVIQQTSGSCVAVSSINCISFFEKKGLLSKEIKNDRFHFLHLLSDYVLGGGRYSGHAKSQIENRKKIFGKYGYKINFAQNTQDIKKHLELGSPAILDVPIFIAENNLILEMTNSKEKIAKTISPKAYYPATEDSKITGLHSVLAIGLIEIPGQPTQVLILDSGFGHFFLWNLDDVMKSLTIAGEASLVSFEN